MAKKIAQNLILINENELDFLNNNKLPFDNGYPYINSQHLYSYDLDFFGDNSIFQYLNRTETYIGGKLLAELLKFPLSKNEIELNQEAIKELSTRVEWRQNLAVLCKISQDSKDNYLSILKWLKKEQDSVSKFILFISYLSPILFTTIAILSYVTNNTKLVSVLIAIFLINLIIKKAPTIYLKGLFWGLFGFSINNNTFNTIFFFISILKS